MLNLFKTKCPVDKDEWDWLLATFKWLLDEFESEAGSGNRRLVLPEPEYFPSIPSDPEQSVQAMFEHVKSHAGMSEWPTRLIVGESTKPANIQPGFRLNHETFAPCGTFQIIEESPNTYIGQITYNPDILRNPGQFIATMAHELAHYLLFDAKTVMPGGRELEEHATDVAAVYLGYGIFLANNARTFEAFTDFDQQGWQSQSVGYLSETALVTCFAISEILADRDPLANARFLKPHLASDLKKAVKFIAQRDIRLEIEQIDLHDYGTN